MKIRIHRVVLYIALGLLSTLAVAKPVPAIQVDASQIGTLLPDWQDLQEFTKASPTGELGKSETFQNGRWKSRLAPAVAIPDDIDPDVNLSQRYSLRNREIVNPWQGHYSKLTRTLFSDNGMYRLHMTIWLCDSPQAAQNALEEYHESNEAIYQIGTFTGIPQIGNASWFCKEYLPNKSLIFLAGKIIVLINGGPSQVANNKASQEDFPDVALEAVACQILINASQKPDLTSVLLQQSSISVNGQSIPKNALLVAGRTYVPVTEFAKAMGLTSHWDTKTGALTLSGIGRKTVALTAGSTAATVGGAKAAALVVPVLKQAGQPVMTLDDLLTLTGGKITGRSGNTVQVKT